jgi:cysteine sulfinate desulfinase/cysteine desulfurase-like protein
LLEHLDARGFFISAGAACASQKTEASSVTRALGLSRERGLEVFRVSFSQETSIAQAEDAARAIITAARELRGEAHAT